MGLEDELRSLEARSAARMEALYERVADRRGFDEEVVALLTSADLQIVATWLLKRRLEETGSITPVVTRQLVASLSLLKPWEARLHVLQGVPYLEIEAESKPAVERFLRDNLSDPNKFVRAWAYGGMDVLATQYPEFADEVRTLFDWAMMNEAPSVKARIRQISR